MNETNVTAIPLPDISVETARLREAEQALPGLLSASEWQPDMVNGLDAAAWGRDLWRQESAVEHKSDLACDDRRLYWRRLACLSAMQRSGAPAADCSLFEAGSRGFLDLDFDGGGKHVLITGFDPFHLDTHIEQSNPSGAVALTLGRFKAAFRAEGVHLNTAIIPVRYADFDRGIVENLLARNLSSLAMVITVSMGREGFDLERFPGLRRSVTTPDNLNRQGGGTASAPIVPPELSGPEFVEFSLPVEAMRAAQGDYPVNDNRVVTTLVGQTFASSSLAELDDDIAVQGSGGGYLSNEISYRVINELRARAQSVRAGHIHTPRVSGYDAPALNRIVSQTIDLIAAGISSL